MFFSKKHRDASEGDPDAIETRLRDAVEDLSKLAHAAQRGDFAQSVDPAAYSGALAEVMQSVNAILASMRERTHWYEALLDSVPFPISVTDADMRWTFVNRPVEQFLGVRRSEVLGKQCNNWNTNICKTPDCGVARLRAGEPTTTFHQGNRDYQVQSAYVHDSTGRPIGHVEVVQDVTVSTRAKKYQVAEAERISAYLSRVAQGELVLPPPVSPPDENAMHVYQVFKKINDHLEQVVSRLRDLIGEVQSTASRMASASEQIKVASEQSAQATQQVASTIQQVSMDAHASSKASESVAEASRLGTETVRRNVDAMRTITHSVSESSEKIKQMQSHSTQIGEIVETIDEIAEQTNLLALNAAIEAARAGEHGRGFAVVADEVRKLAERAGSSTKEIAGLIRSVQAGIDQAVKSMDGSLAQVEVGANLAEEAGQALNQIFSTAETSTQQVKAISAGAEDVAAMTQELSAQVQEFSASAQSLQDLAGSLQALASRFEVDGHEAPLRLPIGRLGSR